MRRGGVTKGERVRGEVTLVVGTVRVASARLRCTTCGGEIKVGAGYRADQWRSPVGGEVLTSRICAECRAEGL